MGQALMPEHFYAQEDALREEVALRLRMGSTPGWGIGSLGWNEALLQKGAAVYAYAEGLKTYRAAPDATEQAAALAGIVSALDTADASNPGDRG